MSIVSVKEKHVGREGEKSVDGSMLRRMFIVQTNSTKDGPGTVMNAVDPSTGSAIPAMFAFYTNGGETSLRHVLKRKLPRQMDGSPYVWEVACEYETKKDDDDDEPNPVLRPATYTWTTAQEEIELLTDQYNVEVRNSVGDPFDPAPTSQKSYQVLTVERNESSFSAYTQYQYVDTVNQSTAFGYGAREGLMRAINAKSEYDADYGAYWTVTYEIHFKVSSYWVEETNPSYIIRPKNKGGLAQFFTPGPWDLLLRNVGTRYRDSTSCTVVADNANGCLVAFTTDGLQDQSGRDLKPDGTILVIQAGVADAKQGYYCAFRPWYTMDWSPLALE